MKFYLRSGTAVSPPTAGKKSSANPKFTAGANIATGANEQFPLSITKGGTNGGGSNSFNSDATVSTRTNYLGRWSSLPLAPQTFGSGTWTFAAGLNESNTSADSFLSLSIYVWRPGTNSVVGYIYDASTDLGTEWAAAVTGGGKVQTVAGSNVTCQLGDILVIEVYRNTAAAGQGMASAYAQIIYYGGATEPTAASNVTTTDTGSYIDSPATVTLAVTNADTNTSVDTPSGVGDTSKADTASGSEGITLLASRTQADTNTEVDIPSTSGQINLDQTAFRFYDDGTETGSAALAAQNTNIEIALPYSPIPVFGADLLVYLDAEQIAGADLDALATIPNLGTEADWAVTAGTVELSIESGKRAVHFGAGGEASITPNLPAMSAPRTIYAILKSDNLTAVDYVLKTHKFNGVVALITRPAGPNFEWFETGVNVGANSTTVYNIIKITAGTAVSGDWMLGATGDWLGRIRILIGINRALTAPEETALEAWLATRV